METIVNLPTRGHIKDRLQNLAQGIDGLGIYDQAMDRIEDLTNSNRMLAHKALSWIIFAKRPISTEELRHALAIKLGTTELDEDYLPKIRTILSLCAGLLTVDEQSNIIRLVHYTTQEYFEQTEQKWAAAFDADIARACVTYLSFSVFETSFLENIDAWSHYHVLYNYAAEYWGQHARGSPVEVEEPTLQFLKNEAKLSSSFSKTVTSAFPSNRKISNRRQYPFGVAPAQTTAGHVAAYFGLEHTLRVLLDEMFDPNSRDSYRATPLLYAAQNGHLALASLLLDRGAHVNPRGCICGLMPLLRAIKCRHGAVAQLLLSRGADANAIEHVDGKTDDGKTSLLILAEDGDDSQEVIVRLLLANGANIEARDDRFVKATPLLFAMREGSETISRLLVEAGANVNASDRDGITALMWATRNGSKSMVRLLLDHGADVNTYRPYSWTVLYEATRKGDEVLATVLLEKQADVDPKDGDGRTPLFEAILQENETMAKLLLNNGADPNALDGMELTPLASAAITGNLVLVKLLLERGAKVHLEGNLNPLKLAIKHDRIEVARVLLDNGADYTRVLRFIASSSAAIRLVLNMGTYINIRDSQGRNLLFHAARRASRETVGEILDRGAAINMKDCQGQTPLYTAAKYGNLEVLVLLLDRGAEIHVQDHQGRTPLWVATEHGKQHIFLTLLERGAEIDVKDCRGWTLLMLAAEHKNLLAFSTLIERGASDNMEVHEVLALRERILLRLKKNERRQFLHQLSLRPSDSGTRSG